MTNRNASLAGRTRTVAILSALLLWGFAPAHAQQTAPSASSSNNAQGQSDQQSNDSETSGAAQDGNASAAAQPSAGNGMQPFQPMQILKPLPSAEAPVNATGGLITSHPADIFTQPTTYSPGQVHTQDVEPSSVDTPAPVEQVLARTPELMDLNENASSVQYSDRHQGPFNIQTEITGVYTNNLFNNFENTNTVGGFYMDFALPVGYEYKGAETTYNAYFRGDITRYPSYSQLNHTSEIFSQDLNRHTSDLTTWDWTAGGGRIIDVEEYLPPVLAIGSTGVSQASFANGLQPMYNLASTLTVTHRVTDEDSLIGSVTGGWMQEPFGGIGPGQANVLNRDETAGVDAQWQHAINSKQALGLEMTDVYVRGLSPVGNSNFTALEGTFHQALVEHGSITLAFGPLYSSASAVGYPSSSNYSYTANASFDYQNNFAHIGFGYQRLFQLGYLAPATVAHELFFVFDKPITRTMDVTLDTRDIRAFGNSSYAYTADYSDFGLSARLADHLTPFMSVFVGTSMFKQSGLGTTLGANNVSAGITYTFGNPFARSGVR